MLTANSSQIEMFPVSFVPTPEQAEKVRQMHKEGANLNAIAAYLHKRRAILPQLFRDLGLKKRCAGRWEPEHVDQLKEAYARGLSSSLIAKEFGGHFTEGAIRRKALEIGLRRNGQVIYRIAPYNRAVVPWTPERDATMREMFEDGLSAAAVAKALGVSRSSVMGRSYRTGIKSKLKPFGTGYRLSPEEKAKRRPRRKAPRISEAIASLEVAINEPLCLSIMELESHHCRYPVGDFPFLYCGNVVAEGHSWCKGHCGIVYTPEDKRESVRILNGRKPPIVFGRPKKEVPVVMHLWGR